MHLLKKNICILVLVLCSTNCHDNHENSIISPTENKQHSSPVRASGVGSPGGIPNLGGTCYMNSVLQILKAFYLPKIKGKNDTLATSVNALMRVIQDDKEVANKDEATAVFKALHTKFNWTTDTSEHADASQLMVYILDWMDLPTFNIEHKFIDTTSHTETLSAYPSLIYTLPAQQDGEATIQDLFNNSFKPDARDKKEAIRRTMTTVANLDKLYKGMIVLRLDWSSEKGSRQKRTDKVRSPLHLTIKKEQTLEKDRDRNYELIGYIWHTGSMNFGHYVAYIHKGNQWICYNDNRVRAVSDAEAKERAQEAFLFFYQPSQVRKIT